MLIWRNACGVSVARLSVCLISVLDIVPSKVSSLSHALTRARAHTHTLPSMIWLARLSTSDIIASRTPRYRHCFLSLSLSLSLSPLSLSLSLLIAGWQHYLSVVILDLSPLGDGVTQACFIVVACLFGLMALSVLLRPMPVDEEAIHPAFSGLNKLLLQLGFIPALRLALTMTRCQYTDETVPVGKLVDISLFLSIRLKLILLLRLLLPLSHGCIPCCLRGR